VCCVGSGLCDELIACSQETYSVCVCVCVCVCARAMSQFWIYVPWWLNLASNITITLNSSDKMEINIQKRRFSIMKSARLLGFKFEV
jgi:hypothetical protein